MLRRPRPTFEALAAAPRSTDVLVAAFLVAFSASALVLETGTGELALLDQLERLASAFGQPIDEAEYARLREISANGVGYALVTSLVGGPLLAAGASAALVLWGRTRGQVRGSTPTFRQVLAVASHAGVILALRQVIAAPLTYARETLASPLTLGALVPVSDEGSPLGRFTGMIDVFVIWWIVVLAIGVSVLYQRPVARLAMAFAGVYVLLAALAALAAAITGGAA